MTDSELSPAQVEHWLQNHPEFLLEHPNALTALSIPHESGAVSLIERQINLLRQENQRVTRQLNYLTGVAGENERLMQRLHRLSLELMATNSPTTLIECLQTGLKRDFQADAVCLLVSDPNQALTLGPPATTLPTDRPEWLDRLIQSGTPHCGRLTCEKRTLLFGDDGESLGSAALVPMVDSDHHTGLLGIGARSADRFHAERGTLFLQLLGETLAFRLELARAADHHDRRARA
ncbi:MAG: DUF484 family protein [Wenzhouxiangellaceae bacterium]